MTTPDEISQMLREECIDFVQERDADGGRWLIFYALGVIVLELSVSGESIRFRTGPIIDLTGLSAGERYEQLCRAMSANERLGLGRYCGTEQINFEIGMPFPSDSPLSTEQLMLGIRTAAAIGSSPELV